MLRPVRLPVGSIRSRRKRPCPEPLRPMTRMQLIRTIAAWRPDLTGYRQVKEACRISLSLRLGITLTALPPESWIVWNCIFGYISWLREELKTMKASRFTEAQKAFGRSYSDPAFSVSNVISIQTAMPSMHRPGKRHQASGLGDFSALAHIFHE